MPASSKQTKGKRKLTGQVDYVALSRDLVDAVDSGVYIVQSKKFVYVNPFFAKLTGYSREELIGTRSFKLVLPQDRPSVRKKATRNLKSRVSSKPYEYRFIKKNGEIMWVMERVSPIEYMGQKATLGSFVDITQRKQLEEALAHSEETYRNILEQMYDSYYEVDLSGNFTFVNDSVCQNLGYSREEMVGQSYRFTTPPDDIKPLLLAFNQVFSTGLPNIGFAHGILRKDGSIISVESSISLRENERGEIIGFRSVSRDITVRKQLEEAVIKSEERYRTILEQLQDAYYEVDLAGNFTFINESTGYSFGYSREELIGQNYHLVIPEEDIKAHFAVYNEVYRTGKPNKGFAHKIRCKDGSILFSEVAVDLRRDEQGKVIGFKSVSRDITKRRQMEEELQKLASIVRYSSELVNLSATDGKMIFINAAGARMLGVDPENLDQVTIMQVIPDHLKEQVQSELLPALLKGGTWEGDLQYLNLKTGLLTDVHALTFAIQDPSTGAPLYFANISLDITERKRAENALRDSEERLRTSMENAPDGIYMNDLEGNFLYGNRRCEEIIGYTREELIGKNFLELNILPEDSLARAAQILQDNINDKPTGPDELELINKEGHRVPLEINTSIVRQGDRKVVLAFVRDITERKKAEEALKESQERYRALFDRSLDLVYVRDFKGNFVDANPASLDLLGYRGEDIANLNFASLLDPSQFPRTIQILEELSETGFQKVPSEYSLKRKDGTYLYVETQESVIYRNGKPHAVQGVGRDITRRKKAEEALQESEEKYRSLVENINDVFYSLDTEGNITYISPVVERFTLYKVGDLMGKSFIPLIYPDDLPALLDSFNRLVSGQLEPSEFRVMDKDGRIIFVRTSSRPLYKDGEIVGITALMTDITERKQMERKLEEMATHDYLTGLPNRVLLTDRFTMAAALAHRNKARLAVMSLDLDKFKTINDTLGHDAGDQVLKSVSKRLGGIIRASDTLARVGGDEFILVMMETNHREDATVIAQKILDSFAEPLSIDGHRLHLTTSIGIAIYPEDAQDLETLTKKSDAAMYYSKGHGRNQFKFFGEGDVRLSGDHRSAPLI
jgi:diguanylate cyclase (GGDEF)-like protein/PAS domain S-box-containing protein